MVEAGDIITLTAGSWRLQAPLGGSSYGQVWRAASVLDDWLARTDTLAFRHSLLAARVLVAGALSREVSVGAHFRADAPDGRPVDPRHLSWRAEPRAVVVSSPSGRIPTA